MLPGGCLPCTDVNGQCIVHAGLYNVLQTLCEIVVIIEDLELSVTLILLAKSIVRSAHTSGP